MLEVEETEFKSNLLSRTPPDTRTVAEKLQERQAALYRTIDDEPPMLEALIKHADRYGSECVCETAAELGYGEDALTRLFDACDRADLEFLRKTRANAKLEKRAPAEKRARKMLGLTDDDGE